MSAELLAGRYEIGRKLGSGGMSTVFLGTDSVLERQVALKILSESLASDGDFVARFRREALAAARLTHPNIVQVFDSGEDRDSERHYIVMEFVDGSSCADLLRERKRFDIDRAIAIVVDACHGLGYAHRAGVIHRDVKPGNLLLAEETGVTKLADFGIAKAAEQTRITQVGSVLGTAAYLSPEQARGEESGPQSDLYSLGVCAYQFLTGRLPHEYSSLTELALKQQEDEVERITVYRPEVPPEIDEAVRLCLRRYPENRYGSAQELAEALDAGVGGDRTRVTRRLTSRSAVADADATRALGDLGSATQAMRERRTGAHRPVAPSEPRPEERGANRKRAAAWVFFLAVLVAALVVGYLLLSSGGATTSGVDPVDNGSVSDQIQGMREFLRENRR